MGRGWASYLILIIVKPQRQKWVRALWSIQETYTISKKELLILVHIRGYFYSLTSVLARLGVLQKVIFTYHTSRIGIGLRYMVNLERVLVLTTTVLMTKDERQGRNGKKIWLMRPPHSSLTTIRRFRRTGRSPSII